MKKNIAIDIQNLSKSFYQNLSIFDIVKFFLPSFSKITKKKVLNKIDLKVYEGETLGIIGRNGAGKSTLLRILTGTLEPSSGYYKVFGTLSSILELGTGFHDDLTGRQNIIMGGLALGIKRKIIESKIDEIINFSELEEVIDDKFSTYSSGMKARLTFSTAISNEPDILIVDEALSVGDAAFQVKCFNWFQKLKTKNKTIILVSHDSNTITKLCDRAVLIENGEIMKYGDPFTITNYYQKILFDEKSNNKKKDTNVGNNVKFDKKDLRYGNNSCFIYDFFISDKENNRVEILNSGYSYKVNFFFEAKQDIKNVSYGFAFKDRQGTVVSGITNMSQNGVLENVEKSVKYQVELNLKMNLYNGFYSITFGLAEENGNKIDFIENGILFEVKNAKSQFTNSIVNLNSNIILKRIDANIKD